MLGYWKRPEATAKSIRNGWFHTGDIGRVDEDGYFYIVDRLKDMVNVGGLKVYPVEIENTIYQHAAVEEVAVYGLTDSLMGERVCANIVCKAGQKQRSSRSAGSNWPITKSRGRSCLSIPFQRARPEKSSSASCAIRDTKRWQHRREWPARARSRRGCVSG
jgi:acyl-CoA synthetase (AMP-forming)/AMP-acid ligase II